VTEIEQVALWMMSHGYATGHGDTVEAMLAELEAQARERGSADRVAWQPIETAPEHGLVWLGRPEEMVLGAWNRKHSSWIRSDNRQALEWTPTCWRPWRSVEAPTR
jgi:hypothetical protein